MNTWIGRKKLAFIPVHRSNAHPPDNPVPADWPSDILRRVLFDPAPTTGADRSLRAYIRAASSGRADLDVAVMPMQVVDKQDVPVDAFEGQFGSQLRGQGFDAAAVVTLGGPGAGSAQRGGFWARFAMAEGLGTWAMELMHSLTSFDDLYPFGGNMGRFDEMADGNIGVHPSAYTKAAINWLDASAIAQHHAGSAATYDLYSVGLVQPPPSGRVAAVRIGSQVPYLMVEARQMVDQFDANIPSQGVIVYRVQTHDPLGHAEPNTPPVLLLTTTALTVGQTFTAGANVKVKVLKALPGGFSVSVDDTVSAIGFVTDYEVDRVDPTKPPGPNNPAFETIELDSTPGFLYTSTGGPHYAQVVKKARDGHRKVEITYTPIDAQSGKILSVKLK
jgi:hypothetical protein